MFSMLQTVQDRGKSNYMFTIWDDDSDLETIRDPNWKYTYYKPILVDGE